MSRTSPRSGPRSGLRPRPAGLSAGAGAPRRLRLAMLAAAAAVAAAPLGLVLPAALPAALLLATAAPAAAQSFPPSRGPRINLPDCLDAGSCTQLPLDTPTTPGRLPDLPIIFAPPAVDESILTWSNSFNEGLLAREREDRQRTNRTSPQGNRP